MPRISRKQSPTGVYHVMLRGIDRGRVFADDQDCRKFIKILRQLTNPKDKDNQPLPPYCDIHAYCLMSNHIHLLLAEGAESLSSTMKRIGVAYVSYFNKRHDRLGPLFHDRFRSEPVCDANYFVTLLRYIHCNPVEAGMVESPDQYQWSSWHEYSGSITVDCVCRHKFPFGRMSWKKACELAINVSEKHVSRPKIERRRLTDGESCAILDRICKGEAIKDMPMERRKQAVMAAINAGVGMRQLARIAKIEYKSIVLIKSKSADKECFTSEEPSL